MPIPVAMHLDRVVPWGRSLAEYTAMFRLDRSAKDLRILGCADGPASFNAELTKLGGSVVSFDPLYRYSGEQIRARFEAGVEEVMSQVRAAPDHWVWKFHRNPEDLERNRRLALARFLEDYDHGRCAGRYLVAEFPNLPFVAGRFDLALCSHFLFLYSGQFSEDFHCRSLLEMCRVAREVRVFPVLTLGQEPSPYLQPIRRTLVHRGYRCEIRRVDYQLQRGGNHMLHIFSG